MYSRCVVTSAFYDHPAYRRDRQQADEYGQTSAPYGQQSYQPPPHPPASESQQFYQPSPAPQQHAAAVSGQFQPGQEQGYTMFEDTSRAPSQPPPSNPFGGVAGNLLNNPAMTSAAMDYGAEVAKDMMEQNVSSAAKDKDGCVMWLVPCFYVLLQMADMHVCACVRACARMCVHMNYALCSTLSWLSCISYTRHVVL